MRPRRVGTFLMSRRPTSAKLSARSMIRSMSERSRSAIASRCFIAAPPPLVAIVDLVDAVQLLDPHVDPLLARGRQVLADVVGADRQLAVAAVDEHGELHPLGAAVVEQRVDRRPHRAPGEQDVVDQHDGAPVEVEVEVRGVDDRLRARLADVDVVAVEARCRGRRAGPRIRSARRPARAAARPARRRGCGCRPARRRPSPGSSRRSRARSAPACGADRRGRGRPCRQCSTLCPFLASLDRVKGTDAASLAAVPPEPDQQAGCPAC